MEKDKLIKKEIGRLRKIFKDIPEDKKKLTEGLVSCVGFMHVTLAELEVEINDKGYSVSSPQGVKKTPEVDIYNTMLKNYLSGLKQLCDLLDKNVKVEIDAELESFNKFRAK